MRRTAFLLAITSFLLSYSASRADEAALRIAVVQSGYPGSAKTAKGFLETLKSHLEKTTGLTGLALSYQNIPKDALAEIEKAPPRFGVVSLGFYLENRVKLGMRAHLETSPQERFFVVTRRDGASSMSELTQKSVAGGALYEPHFLDWVVFPEAPVSDWKSEPTLRISRALRNLSRGKHDALVLNGREYRSLEAVGKLQGLMKIGESKPFPIAVVVSFHDSLKKRVEKTDAEKTGETKDDEPAAPLSEAQQKLVAAFRELSKDKSGQAILSTMGCKEFRAVDAERMKKLEDVFEARRSGGRAKPETKE